MYELHFAVPMFSTIFNNINTCLDTRTVSVLLHHSEAISLFPTNTPSFDSSSSPTIRARRHAQHHSITFCAHMRTSWTEATRGSSGSRRRMNGIR
ncbi:hypothetical protein EV1_033769 [Malus domestica]